MIFFIISQFLFSISLAISIAYCHFKLARVEQLQQKDYEHLLNNIKNIQNFANYEK